MIVNATFGLSAGAVEVYETLWGESGQVDGFLAGGAALKFLVTSGLSQADLKTIWGLSDTVAPKGKLSKDEFFRAAKLVALQQAGRGADVAKLSEVCPLPKLGSCPGGQ